MILLAGILFEDHMKKDVRNQPEMITEILISTVVFLVTWWLINRPKHLPPIVGILPYLEDNSGYWCTAMSRRYGDVFAMKLGGQLAIVLNSYEVIREAFVKNGGVFSGRPHDVHSMVKREDTIARQPDKKWKTLRTLYKVAFRRFGINKDAGVIEVKSLAEIGHLCGLLDSKEGREIPNFLTEVKKFTCNVITSIVYDVRYDYDSDLYNTAQNNICVETRQTYYMSKLRNTFNFFTRHFAFMTKKAEIVHDVSREMAARHIEDHKYSLDPKHSRDILDTFLNATDSGADFRLENLDASSLAGEFGNLLHTATSSLPLAITWMFLYMADHQRIQKSVQRELDEGHTDNETWIQISERRQLPYTTACINEVIRHKMCNPIGVYHATSADIRFRGFDIPKNTMVIANLHSVHMAERYWKNPQVFEPNQWIEDGKFVVREGFMPFSVGPRLCVAKQLAEQEIFLVFANLMKRFCFLPPEGDDGIDLKSTNHSLPTPVVSMLRVVRR
ncbi:cytochrome P450 2F2-like [Glandiceps talaboti]